MSITASSIAKAPAGGPVPETLLDADVVLVQFDDFWGEAIQTATQQPGEGPTFAGHCEVVVRESGKPPLSVGATTTVTKIRPLASLLARPCVLAVVRYRPFLAPQRSVIASKARSYVGRVYGYPKLAAHFGDALISRLFRRDVYFFRWLCRMDTYPICSWEVAFSYDAVGYQFGVRPNAAQPDDVADHAMGEAGWELVWLSSERARAEFLAAFIGRAQPAKGRPGQRIVVDGVPFLS